MEKEIENFRELAKRFLSVESYDRIIPTWKQELINLKNDRGASSFNWSIPINTPIKTIISKGQYEPGTRRGRLNVFGTICGTWDISVERRDAKTKAPFQAFILKGIASTKVQIWTQEDNPPHKEIARWTLETGDANSPGCHFHTQIDLDPEDNKFPKDLSVPRLPAYLHTPMDALDFLLGELFQDDWFRHISQRRDAGNVWNGCQKARLVKMLEWHSQQFKCAGGAPWATFKRRKPTVDLLFS